MLKIDGLLFDKQTVSFGTVAKIDFIEEKYTLDNGLVVKFEDAVYLPKIGKVNGISIFNHDVIFLNNKKAYEVELNEDENLVYMHLLDSKLNRVKTGESCSASVMLEFLSDYQLQIVGNMVSKPEEKTVDFNITVVRAVVLDDVKYYYACNNAENEEVDLIKVIFVGSTLLEEEKHERITVSHEQYLDMIEEGELVEVSPNQLQNYVTGKLYGQKSNVCEDCSEDCGNPCYEEDVEEEEDFCADCGKFEEDCNCD